jgi:hypothetical protein
MRRFQPQVGFLLALVALTPAAQAQPFFADGFESGNTLAWSQSLGEPPLVSPNAFRTTELLLRDPHLFVDLPIFGCFDFTDNDLPLSLGPSFNSQLETAIEEDGDGDGNLDLSLMILGRPMSPAATSFRLDTASGLCPAGPSPLPFCDRDPATVPQTHTYSAQGSGTCLAPLAGTTSGYTPAPAAPTAPCYLTVARHLNFEAADVQLPQLAVQSAATLVGSPTNNLVPGLLRGFLTEEAADSILLPADLPIVGGQPFSILLPGGQGNCAGHDARDTFESQSGWWFYFDTAAVQILWVGP